MSKGSKEYNISLEKNNFISDNNKYIDEHYLDGDKDLDAIIKCFYENGSIGCRRGGQIINTENVYQGYDDKED